MKVFGIQSSSRWLCAAYALTTGQSDAARELAEAAAQAKPEYRDQLQLLGL